LVVRSQPVDGVSGLTLQPLLAVEVLRPDGQRDDRSTSPIAVALASGIGALSGTTTLSAVSGLAQFTDLRIDGAGDHTLQFTGTGLTAAISNRISVRQVAASLVMQVEPSGAADGASLATQPRVQVVDNARLPMSVAAPVTASIISGNGVLGGTTTVTSVNGIASFIDLAITGSGPHLLSFESPGIDRVTSDEFTVSAASGVATRLAVAKEPSGGTTGIPLPIQPVVEVRDQSNNAVAGSSVTVTATLASGTGALSGTTAVSAVNGVVTFTNLTISGLGLHTLRFTAPGLVEATTIEFRVIAAP
jgi:hypothetical protein